MPINRTPPASPLPVTTTEAPDQIKSTNYDIAATTINASAMAPAADTASNVSTRRKKAPTKQNDKGCDTLSMSTFTTFSRTQEKRFDDLIDKINNIIGQNCDLKCSVELMSTKHDEFLERIALLETERKEDKKRIKQLEDTIENLERKSRCCSLEIRNAPKLDGETKENLSDLIVNLGKTINVNVDSSHIREVFRVNSKDKSNPVIVELTTALLKSKFIRGVKDFNRHKTNSEKLNTSHINQQQPSQPLYIAEALTFKTQRLYSLARTFKKTHGYLFCWTSNGAIYLRKQVNDPQIRVHSETDLDKLRTA